jgi:hypothetical protein
MPFLTGLETLIAPRRADKGQDNTLLQYLADLRELATFTCQRHDKLISLDGVLASGALKRRLFARVTVPLTGRI